VTDSTPHPNTSTGDDPAALTWAKPEEMLGMPNVSGRRRLVVAVAVDSLGSGLFLPFSLIYFVKAHHLSLVSVGAALSLAALAAAAASPVGGLLIDRLGPRSVVVLSNLLRAFAFLGYPMADQTWLVAVLAAVVAWGDNVFWPATGALTTVVADPGQRPRWFAMNRTLQNAGLGLGGLCAGLLLTRNGEFGYQALVVINAFSFLCAAGLVGSWRRTGNDIQRHNAWPATKGGGYRMVVRDHSFMFLVAVNTLFALCHLTLTALLPVYLTIFLHGPSWLPAALFSLNTILVVLAQMTVSRLTEFYNRIGVLRLAARTWAVSFIAFALLAVGPEWWMLCGAGVGVVIFTVAEMLHLPASSTLVAEMSSEGLCGRYMSFNQLSWSIAGIVGPIMFTGLPSLSPTLPWTVLVGCCLLALLLLRVVAYLAPKRTTHPVPAAPSCRWKRVACNSR
jgi:MFS family permease